MEKIPELTPEQIDRFWSHVDRCEPDECWEWQAAHGGIGGAIGYGKFNLNRHTRSAHRLAYFLKNKSQPGELDVCHSCDNKLCCNPAHLFLGTRRENLDDMLSKGRSCFGNKNFNARLAVEQVQIIRRSKEPQTVLAGRFGVSQQHISQIQTRKRWKHVA